MNYHTLVRHEMRRNRPVALAELILFLVILLSLKPLLAWMRLPHDSDTVSMQTVLQLVQWGITATLALCGGLAAGCDARNRWCDAAAQLPVSGFRLWLAKYDSVLRPSLPGLALLLVLTRGAPEGTWTAGLFAVIQAVSFQSIVFQVTLGARSESNRMLILGFSACFLLFLAGPVWYPAAVIAAWPVSLAAGAWYYTGITLRGRNAPVKSILAATAITILMLTTLGRFS